MRKNIISQTSSGDLMAERYHTQFRFFDTLASDATATHVFNLPKLMSSANRREFKNVDNQGNAQLYTIGMKLHGTNAEAYALTAPNTYVTKNAVKGWHDARVLMFKQAGISMKSLGYGRSLRPYLDVNHQNGTTTEIDTETATSGGILPAFEGQEWNYSQAAVSTPMEEEANTQVIYDSQELVDTYHFTLLGDSVAESDGATGDQSDSGGNAQSFVSVGMISEWLDSFKKRQTVVSATAIDADNALLQLMSSGGPQVEEVLELAEDQQEELRPWDLDGSAYTTAFPSGYAKTLGLGSDYVVFQAPCGLFNITMSNSHSGSEIIQCAFDVLDIEDM